MQLFSHNTTQHNHLPGTWDYISTEAGELLISRFLATNHSFTIQQSFPDFLRFSPRTNFSPLTFVTTNLSQIGENCTSLTHLSLANCHLLKPADFQVFKILAMSSKDSFYLQALAPLEHLVSLNLYRTSVSQTALLAILCNNRDLEDLNLSACPNIQGDEVPNGYLSNLPGFVLNFLKTPPTQ